MKQLFAALILVSIVWTPAFSAPKGPQVDLIDNKLSIQAESISLARLLRLVDFATGMKSKVPPELANRNISVRFSGLSLSDGLRKMFQGQPFDYVVIEGQGIIVTAPSQTLTAADAQPPYNPPMAGQPMAGQPMDQPFVQDFQSQAAFQQQQQLQQQQLQQQQMQLQQMQQQQPAMVQTPFGPMPNPRAQQNQQNPAVINQPQQNTLFPQIQQAGQPQQPVQVVPGQPVPGNPNPFGTASPFGTPNPQVNPNNGLFGAVPVITPGAQQPR